MPNFFYTAKALGGEARQGSLEAADEKELAKILRQEGFFLLSAVKEEKEKKTGFGAVKINLPFLNNVSLAEKMLMTKNLQVMVKAGLSLPRAFTVLARQTKNPVFKKALLKIGDEINTGKSFFESLSSYKEFFSPLFINMVKVGEESGTLEEVLGNLHYQMEKENDLRSRVIGALIYPAVITSAMFGVGALMLAMIVPKLAQTFNELKVELPVTTKAIIWLGEFISERWYFVLLGFVILVLAVRRFLKTKKGKELIDNSFLILPVVSKVVRGTNNAHFSRTLSSLITAGVPIVSSLSIIAGALTNSCYQKALLEISKKVSQGQKLSESMALYGKVFPIMILQMLEVGEETGQTSEILSLLADFYEEEVVNYTKNLSSVIEPVLMILVGGAVGFFAISMIQPMYSIMRAV